MRGTRSAILLAVVTLMSAAPAAAQTKHFTITVPVEVHNLMPEVSAVEVFCVVYPDATMLTQRVGMGQMRQAINTATGEYIGNVVVAFDADPGQDPASGKAYNCAFNLIANVVGQPSSQQPLESHASPVWRPAPGTVFVGSARGTLQ